MTIQYYALSSLEILFFFIDILKCHYISSSMNFDIRKYLNDKFFKQFKIEYAVAKSL